MWFVSVRWPSGSGIGVRGSTRSDHQTKEEAKEEIKKLEEGGWNGEGKVFPLETTLEPEQKAI